MHFRQGKNDVQPRKKFTDVCGAGRLKLIKALVDANRRITRREFKLSLSLKYLFIILKRSCWLAFFYRHLAFFGRWLEMLIVDYWTGIFGFITWFFLYWALLLLIWCEPTLWKPVLESLAPRLCSSLVSFRTNVQFLSYLDQWESYLYTLRLSDRNENFI